MLTREASQKRQRRLRKRLSEQKLDAAVISHRLEIFYFTGVLLSDRYPALLYLGTDGDSWLVAHTNHNVQCVKECLVFPCHVGATTNPDLVGQLSRVVGQRARSLKRIRRIGYQSESLPKLAGEALGQGIGKATWVAIDGVLGELQRRKDADEVELLRKSARCSLAAYTAAQAAIRPGVTELEVLAAGQRGALLEAGEGIYHDGDYQSGALGGFARNRRIRKGELYIVDAWSIYRGYWSDLCRTYSVGGHPTDLQESIFEHVKAFHRIVPSLLKPGTDGSEVWKAADAHLREHPALADTGLIHHAGHGIGLRPHQIPDLNRDRGGTLEVGNVLSVEPGGYVAKARSGVRLENMYLITETGVENLSEYPIEIRPRQGARK